MVEKVPRIALVAGEVSGDVLGAGLIRALRVRYPDAVFEGVAGPRMRAEGCEPLADIETLSLFGIGEVVREIPRLLRFRRKLIERFTRHRPDVFVGIDAPAFNTGLERKLRQAGLPTVHYVCPTAWAWRENRVRKLRTAVDLMLAIFPFEEAFFARHHVPVRFVGHPLADEIPLHPDADTARHALGLDGDARWLALLPGSRASELRRLGPAFIESAAWLHARLPDVRFVAPMANAELKQVFRDQLATMAPDLPVTLIDGRSREVLRAADVVLLASGTASLEALLLKTPMVVTYAVSPGTYHLVRTLRLLKAEYVSMPNLLANRALVPELLQDQVRSAVAGPWLYRLFQSEPARRAQIDAFADLHAQLRCGADERAAEAVASVLENEQ